MSICANFGCKKPATKVVRLANGTKQNRCEACYARKVAALKKERRKK